MRHVLQSLTYSVMEFSPWNFLFEAKVLDFPWEFSLDSLSGDFSLDSLSGFFLGLFRGGGCLFGVSFGLFGLFVCFLLFLFWFLLVLFGWLVFFFFLGKVIFSFYLDESRENPIWGQ